MKPADSYKGSFLRGEHFSQTEGFLNIDMASAHWSAAPSESVSKTKPGQEKLGAPSSDASGP